MWYLIQGRCETGDWGCTGDVQDGYQEIVGISANCELCIQISDAHSSYYFVRLIPLTPQGCAMASIFIQISSFFRKFQSSGEIKF